MLRKILVASFVIASACAMHLEYLSVDSDELRETPLISSNSIGSVDQIEDLIPGVCFICKSVMKKVKHHLGNHENAERIKGKLMRLCDKMGPAKNICKKMVTKNIDMLVEELSTNDDPKTMCAKAGLCKSMGEPGLFHAILQNFQEL